MITTGNWQDALEPIAIKGAFLGFREKPMERDLLFSVRKSKKLVETYLEMGDIGSFSQFTGDLAFDDVAQGYKMTITQDELAKGMVIQRKFVETDQLDVVEGLPKLIGLAARRKMLRDSFSWANNAFNTSLTTLDALQLCSSAHTSNQEGVATTQSNYGTTAFSEAAVEARRQAMKAKMSNRNQLIDVNPDMLVVPRQLESAAYELIKSSGKVNTANNNRNFHMGKYKLLVSDVLDDANNFFLLDSELFKESNKWNNVVPFEFGQARNFNGLAAQYYGYMFYGFGTVEWRGVDGSEVA